MSTQTAEAVQPALAVGGVAVTVHGTVGVVDIVVPGDAHVSDLAREYATVAGLPTIPMLRDRRGRPYDGDTTLVAAGIASGSLVAADSVPVPGVVRHDSPVSTAVTSEGPSLYSACVVGIAAGFAVFAAWCGAHADSAWLRWTVAGVLAAGAVIGLLPVGRYAVRRALVAPAFAGAATFTIVYDPAPERLPTVVGVAALIAAVVATVARSTSSEEEIGQAMKVWTLAGVIVFAVTALCALVGWPPQVPWSLLFTAAVLAARIVPSYVVDVPDHYLLDLDRLSVNAWTARQHRTKDRPVVPVEEVREVAARGARTLAAASWAVLAVAALAAPALVSTASGHIDNVGTWVLLVAGSFVLLLAARSYRYPLPRLVLRIAGLVVLAVGAVTLAANLDADLVKWIGLALVVIGALVVIAAIATGRGWRSAKWASRADMAEALSGAAVIAALIVSSGVFRHLWESGFNG